MDNQVIKFFLTNKLAVIFSLSISGLLVGFAGNISMLYYPFVAILGVYALFKQQYIDNKISLLVFACLCSILFGDSAPFFNAWMRLGLFVLLLAAIFPWFDSDRLQEIRYAIFKWCIALIVFVAVSSPICYMFGINYMTKANQYVNFLTSTPGWFGGLTRHSMTLGPVCALSATFLTYISFNNPVQSKKIKVIIACCIFASIAGALASASRGAVASAVFGIIVCIFLCTRKRTGKTVTRLMQTIILCIVIYPVLSPFLIPVLNKQEQNVTRGGTFNSREILWNHRLSEFEENPIFGIGFSSVDTKYDSDYDQATGIIEPGSSWLSILSMTGILGSVSFLAIFFPTLSRLYKLSLHIPAAQMIFSLLSVYCIHMITEGYIFAAGNYLSIFFWLLLGQGYLLSESVDIKSLNSETSIINASLQ